MEGQGPMKRTSSLAHYEIILLPLPLQGHITPMLQLGSILHSQGFSITVIHTNFNSPKAANYPHFAFHSIPDGLPEGQTSTADVIAFAISLNLSCGGPLRDRLVELLPEASEDRKACCLITDAGWYSTQAIADDLGIRRMVLRTSSISSFLAFYGLLLAREKGYLPMQDARLEEPVLELPPLKVKDLHVIKTKDPEDLYRFIFSVGEAIKASSGVIFNSFQELENIEQLADEWHREFRVPLYPIGPFHKYFPASASSSLLAQDTSSIPWLNRQKPKSVIYVSFGSLSLIDESRFVEIAWGLADSEQPFLWVVRPGSVLGSTEWLERLPAGFLETVGDRGHIVKWAPQQEVLGHPAVGGFWTHNGWNSTLEAVCEGVPMICMPFFGDQRVNARHISDVWRFGLHLEYKVERREIECAIRRLMVGEEGEEMRQRLKVLKEKAGDCLKQGGASTQSLRQLTEYLISS